MISKEMVVELSGGMEPRPVAMLVQVASQYDSSIYIQVGNKKVNALRVSHPQYKNKEDFTKEIAKEVNNFIKDFFSVVSATYLSASLHKRRPIVSLSPSVFSKSSIALT